MKLGFSQQEIITTAKSLGLPSDGFVQRRVARAQDLVESNKVSQIDDGIFRVRSQYDEGKSYIVNVNSGEPSCDCPDGERTINCKHRIASLLYAGKFDTATPAERKQAQAITIVKTADGNEGDYWRRCWLIAQGNRRTVVYEEHNGRLFCNCGANLKDCKHKQLVIKTVTKELKAISKEKPVVNECGSNEAKALQDKMNGQLDSRNDNGNGAKQAPSQIQLDISDPFQQSEQLDIDQIEGRSNGELVHRLSNGEYVISYEGIMKLAEKHDIAFELATHDDTHTIIAKARRNGSERVSGKPIGRCSGIELPLNGSVLTAGELAKRNAARQLIPFAEIKGLEQKAKLNTEFNWQKAQAKCVELVGDANVAIIIHELVNAGKLRPDNPSHYDRTEWIIIHKACKEDAEQNNDNNDGVSNPPSSYAELAAAPVNDNYWERYTECKELVGMNETDLIIRQRIGWRYSYYKDRITNVLWDEVLQECQWRKNARDAKSERAHLMKQNELDYIKDRTGYDVRSKKYVGRPPLNTDEFVDRCKEAIQEVRDAKSVEANEQPLEGGNGKRKLQMDSKLRTWLIEADGTKKSISCREICLEYDPKIVSRLRAGIDSGADISTVELDD